MATNAAASADTFPKLLIRNADIYGARPSMRHKDLGIWQTWTWSQVLDIVRAYALGLHRLGVKRGETIAIVGGNRPKLYWSVMAAQVLGAIPVPVYADAVADELAYVLAHADVRFAAVEDQEQIDKILSVMARLPKLELMVYDEKRGPSRLRPQPAALDGRRHRGRTQSARRHHRRGLARQGNSRQQGHRSVHHPLYIRHDRHIQGRRTHQRSARSVPRADTVAFDKLTENDVALAYLPLAWVGDHYLNYAQGMVSGFCTACPESPDTAMTDLREIGPSFYFAPPRTLEQLLTRVMIRMEDAGHHQAKAVSLLHRGGASLW